MAENLQTTVEDERGGEFRIEQKRRERASSHYWSGIMYFAAAVGIQALSAFFLDGAIPRMVEKVAREKPLAAQSLSETLNVEGSMARNIDNVVRITASGGVGTGILTDPYTLYTANHVIEESVARRAPIYLQSQSYLAPGESVKVELHRGNVRRNRDTDLAQITLDKPFFRAGRIGIDPKYDFKTGDPNVYAVCYRNREVVTLRGHAGFVFHDPQNPSISFYITDMQGGPGNSGCGVFNASHDLVGLIMAVPNDKPYRTNLDTGQIVFTDVGNPF